MILFLSPFLFFFIGSVQSREWQLFFFFLYLYVAGAVSRCCDALSLKREKGKKKREKNNEPVVVSMFVQLQQASLFSYCSHLYNLHCSAFFFLCFSYYLLFFVVVVA